MESIPVQILILSMFIEALVTTVKWVGEKTPEKKPSVWNWVALGFGVLITPMTGLDLFRSAGIPLAVPYVGSVGVTIGGLLGMLFTGMILCRGSNVLYDLYKGIAGIKDLLKDILSNLVKGPTK